VIRRIALLGLLTLPALLARPAAGEEPLALRSLDDRAITLETPAPGTTLLLHFWATWCPSCREDLLNLDRAAHACNPERVRVIAVNVGESRAQVQRYLTPLGLSLEVLRDPKGRAFREIDGRGLPLNGVWSAAERRSELGPLTASAWRERLEALGCARAPTAAGAPVAP